MFLFQSVSDGLAFIIVIRYTSFHRASSVPFHHVLIFHPWKMDKVGRVKLVLKIDGGEVKNVSMNEAKRKV